MKRRDFLGSASVLGTLAALPAVAAATPAATAPRFVLARADTATPGARFVAADRAECAACAQPALRVRLDASHPAEHGAVLRDFWLSALFDAPGAARSPFLAWHFDGRGAGYGSQRSSFVAERATMREFAIDYRLGDADAVRESCRLTRFDAPLLQPGHYVLAGPRRNGSAVDAATLRHSGDTRAPLALEARDFDYLAFRIEALA